MSHNLRSIAGEAPQTGPRGQLAHAAALAQGQRLQPEFYQVGEHCWCFVGNGLSNQTFVRGPAGIIAIDTGESVEEMGAALAQLRRYTKDQIVAVIYSHFHYVNGTAAILEEPQNKRVQIYAHQDIPANLARFAGDTAPRYNRGLVHQFGTSLTDSGQDGLLHCGLGLFYRNPQHQPYTPGYLPAQHTFSDSLRTSMAGLQVELQHAPSDATDSITIWFPELKLCVNNLVWPALFNVYAIRGEEYRDPRILLAGLDHILSLQPQQLVGTHGPPLTEPGLEQTVQIYRDSIQLLWDQTVRGANMGLTLAQLIEFVQLPALYDEHYLTQQLYGLAEHHVRQIYTGLFGWFDEYEGHLFELPGNERAERCIVGFGGRDVVRQQAETALQAGDYRWALELAAWLVHSADCTTQDQNFMAELLRQVAYRTPSANLRNWCLTRAGELAGEIDLTRHRQPRFSYRQVMAAPVERYVHALRVLINPQLASQLDHHIAWHFASAAQTGLHVRHGVAAPTDGRGADSIITLSQETWAEILSAQTTLAEAVEQGIVSIDGDLDLILRCFATFDLASLR